MTITVKQAILNKFRDVKLDEKQLALLATKMPITNEPTAAQRSLQEHDVDDHATRCDKTSKRPLIRNIAVVVLVIMCIPLANLAYTSHLRNNLISEIAAEAAENHLKLKPLEIESNVLNDVLAYFNKLEFNLVASSVITENSGDILLGGRYCSIKGIDAAQLRVMSSDGALSTWYEGTLPAKQLKLVPNIDAGELPERRMIKGLKIRAWQEHGVLFVEVK